MIHNVYTVYDASAKAYLQPFMSHNDATAGRSFQLAVQEKGHIFNHTPEDYMLYHLGSFEDTTAEYTILHQPKRLLNALEITEGKANDETHVGNETSIQPST